MGAKPTRVLAGLVSVSILAVSGVSALSAATLTSNTATITMPTVASPPPVLAAFNDVNTPVNILVLGSDTREGKTNRTYGDPKVHDTARSDTAMLVHLPAGRTNMSILSIPRDLITTIPTNTPACAGAHRTSTPTVDRFNAAYQIGGATCTIATVTDLTGLPIDHAVTVDFAGVEQLVDTIGGLTICTTRKVDDNDAKLSLAAGTHTLTGAQTLGLLRARKTIGDGSDTARIGRQQYIITEAIRQLQARNVALNPMLAWNLANTVTSSLAVSPGLKDPAVILAAAKQLADIPSSAITTYTYPWKPNPADPLSTVVPDQARVDALLATITNSGTSGGGTGTPKPSGKPTPTPKPSRPHTDSLFCSGE